MGLLANIPFGQTFDPHDLAVIGLLIILEGVMSLDNAMVLGLLARRLPADQRNRALSYGLAGAFLFRTVAVIFAAALLKISWMKLLGGAYLLYLSGRHFIVGSASHDENELQPHEGSPIVRLATGGKGALRFWRTVIAIELTDIAFAIDSIIAAIGVIGSHPGGPDAESYHPKLWVVLIGGILGVVLMRFAAAGFIRLLTKFPRLETSAYLLVAVIGLKLALDWYFNSTDPSQPHVLDFHSPGHGAFWAFWGAMLVSFLVGFVPRRSQS